MSRIDDFRPNPISAALSPENLASYKVTKPAALDEQFSNQSEHPHQPVGDMLPDNAPEPARASMPAITAAHTAAVVHSNDGRSFTVNGTLFHLEERQDPVAQVQGLTIDKGTLPGFTPNPVKSPFSK